MPFLVKALFRWNECSKNADISVLSNFLATFFNFFSIFIKYYLNAKFQINWTIQTKITEGGQNLPFPGHTNLQKSGLFRVNRVNYRLLNIQNIARVIFKQLSSNVLKEKQNLANVRNNSIYQPFI